MPRWKPTKMAACTFRMTPAKPGGSSTRIIGLGAAVRGRWESRLRRTNPTLFTLRIRPPGNPPTEGRRLWVSRERQGETITSASGLVRRIHGLSRSPVRSEEHTSELQSRFDLVCRLLLEKKKKKQKNK